MKRLLIVAIAFIGFSAASFAQTTDATKKKETVKVVTEKKTNAVKVTKEQKPVPAVAAKPAVVAVKETKASPVKKDGTADMRFKANKDAAKKTTTGPLKKDGTKDLRYKENKKHA